MKALSLRRRYNSAVNTIETNYYHYASKLAIPNSSTISKSENTGPIRSNVVDTLNSVIHHAHDAVINGITGWSPSPNERDLVSAIYESASPYIARLAPAMTQFAKSPMALAGAAAICLGALACSPDVRSDVSNTFDKATQIVADASHHLTNKIEEAIPKTLPIEVAVAPHYKPAKFTQG